MEERKNRLHELKIAVAILDTSLLALAREWDVSSTLVYNVARGIATSERISNNIESTIQEAKEVVPFEYPEDLEEPLVA